MVFTCISIESSSLKFLVKMENELDDNDEIEDDIPKKKMIFRKRREMALTLS